MFLDNILILKNINYRENHYPFDLRINYILFSKADSRWDEVHNKRGHMVKALRKSVMGLALGAALMMGWGTASLAAGDELKIAFPVDIPSWDPTSVTFPAG